MNIVTKNYKETKKLGKLLGKLLNKGETLLLKGDLGAGKTTFIQGLAEGLGIKASVTSPTFTIIHEYPGEIPLYHIDAYRLDKEEEILELGLEEYFYSNGITAIEWPEKLMPFLPKDGFWIHLERTQDGDEQRKLTFSETKQDYLNSLKEALKNEDISY